MSGPLSLLYHIILNEICIYINHNFITLILFMLVLVLADERKIPLFFFTLLFFVHDPDQTGLIVAWTRRIT